MSAQRGILLVRIQLSRAILLCFAVPVTRVRGGNGQEEKKHGSKPGVMVEIALQRARGSGEAGCDRRRLA